MNRAPFGLMSVDDGSPLGSYRHGKARRCAPSRPITYSRMPAATARSALPTSLKPSYSGVQLRGRRL
jgi:hypothetical protein